MSNINERNPNDESSMEDILSSIRQILASDDMPEEASKEKSSAKPSYVTMPKEEVLELTEEVLTFQKGTSIETTTPTKEFKKEENRTMTTNAEQDAKLISQKTVEAASQALSKLSEALHPAHAASTPHTPVGGSVTLEILVTQAMQPILKDWMDQNLPRVIEQVVSTEIKKIVRQAT